MMLFGEKYGERVRVVRFGSSVELCGGTHASATGNLGLFKIVSENAISAGIRRIEAVTGEKTEELVDGLQMTLKEVQLFVNNPQVLQAVRKMFEENEDLHKKIEDYRREKTAELVTKFSDEARENGDGIIFFSKRMDLPVEMVKDVAFALRQKMPNLALVLGSVSEGKPTLAVMLGDETVARGLNASAIVREAAKEISGGGGGQPFFATAGGKNPDGIDRAIDKASELIRTQAAG